MLTLSALKRAITYKNAPITTFLIVYAVQENFFVHMGTTFSLEVFCRLNFPRYFLSAKIEKHEIRRASICY